jgi:hypothetical protein
MVQVQPPQHFLEELFLAAFQPMPRHHRPRVSAARVVRHKGVTPEHLVVLLPPGHRQRESEVAAGHGVPDAGVLPDHFHPVAPACLRGRTPGAPGRGFQGGQSAQGGLLWSGDKLEADLG